MRGAKFLYLVFMRLLFRPPPQTALRAGPMDVQARVRIRAIALPHEDTANRLAERSAINSIFGISTVK